MELPHTVTCFLVSLLCHQLKTLIPDCNSRRISLRYLGGGVRTLTLCHVFWKSIQVKFDLKKSKFYIYILFIYLETIFFGLHWIYSALMVWKVSWKLYKGRDHISERASSAVSTSSYQLPWGQKSFQEGSSRWPHVWGPLEAEDRVQKKWDLTHPFLQQKQK